MQQPNAPGANRKLTPEQVQEIRRECANRREALARLAETRSFREIGRAHGLSDGAVGKIDRRENWDWLPEES